MRTQLVAARAAAQTLADLAADPQSTAPGVPILEIAGPRPENLVDMATLYAARTGAKVRIVGVSDPSDPDTTLNESGALLPGPKATLAGPTFEEWLNATQSVRASAESR
jgi:hypothetical protein